MSNCVKDDAYIYFCFLLVTYFTNEEKVIVTSHIITYNSPVLWPSQGGGLGGRPEIQEGIRESHAPLVEALDGAHVLLLTLIINADSPIRFGLY